MVLVVVMVGVVNVIIVVMFVVVAVVVIVVVVVFVVVGVVVMVVVAVASVIGPGNTGTPGLTTILPPLGHPLSSCKCPKAMA